MRRWTLAAAAAVTLLGGVAFLAQPTPAPVDAQPATIRLHVDLEDRLLTVRTEDGTETTYGVAIGKPAHPTPRGEFAIERVIWNPRWVPPNTEWARGKSPREPGDPDNPMGKVKIFFEEPDYYIHGTNAEESIGTAASHGCVRMRNEDVVEVARLIMEHAGERRPESWFRRILNRVRSSSEVRLPQPVTLEISA